MSRENVALFLKTMAVKQDVNRRIHEADRTVEAWISIAKDEGFEINSEELRSVIQDVLGQDFQETTMIEDLLQSQSQSRELSNDELQKVAGGTEGGFRFSLSSNLFQTLDSLGLNTGGFPNADNPTITID